MDDIIRAVPMRPPSVALVQGINGPGGLDQGSAISGSIGVTDPRQLQCLPAFGSLTAAGGA
jgi:hypothetical protein